MRGVLLLLLILSGCAPTVPTSAPSVEYRLPSRMERDMTVLEARRSDSRITLWWDNGEIWDFRPGDVDWFTATWIKTGTRYHVITDGSRIVSVLEVK